MIGIGTPSNKSKMDRILILSDLDFQTYTAGT
jgi:hypothetical protein